MTLFLLGALGPLQAAADCTAPTGPHSEASPARTLRVQAGAPASGADGSADHPFPDPAQALAAAVPGDRVFVEGGDWPALEVLGEGRREAPIFLSGDPADPPRFAGLTIAGSDLVIEDLALTSGIVVGPGRALTLRRLAVTSAADCLVVEHREDLQVEQLSLSGCGGDGIRLQAVLRSHLVDVEVQGVSGDGIRIEGGSMEVEVHGGRIEGATGAGLGLGGSSGASAPDDPGRPAFGGRRLVATGVRVQQAAVGVQLDTCVDCAVLHVALVDNTLPVELMHSNTPAEAHEATRTLRILNNVVLHEGEPVSVGANVDLETTVLLGNLWVGSAPSALSHGLSAVLPPGELSAEALDEPPSASDPRAGRGVTAGESPGDAAGRCWASLPAAGPLEVSP